MRLWHYKLLPYLPDAQFKGQLRELIAIMHDWRDKGHTNHLLINKAMEFSKADLSTYYMEYSFYWNERYGVAIKKQYGDEFFDFSNGVFVRPDFRNTNGAPILFQGWHNKEYLRVCMANLAEKHIYGVGKSRIADSEWKRLLEGYKKITGEDYSL